MAFFHDMSKAFGKVSHLHLLHSLSVVGVAGPLLKWHKIYLSNCFHNVMLNGYSSTLLPVQSGISQGSILGPLLSSFTSTPWLNYTSSPGPVILYADDILLYQPLCTRYDATIFQ